MNVASSVAVAATFLWLGMVVGISFLEAPLKFRAPNVTLQIGLGIGRLIFRALNGVELLLAAVIVAACVASRPPVSIVAAFVAAFAALAAQLLAVRPRLNRRADRVLAGLTAPRSGGHYVYIGFEVVKVVALAAAGILLLSG